MLVRGSISAPLRYVVSSGNYFLALPGTGSTYAVFFCWPICDHGTGTAHHVSLLFEQSWSQKVGTEEVCVRGGRKPAGCKGKEGEGGRKFYFHRRRPCCVYSPAIKAWVVALGESPADHSREAGLISPKLPVSCPYLVRLKATTEFLRQESVQTQG